MIENSRLFNAENQKMFCSIMKIGKKFQGKCASKYDAVKENSKVSFQYIMAFRIKKIFTNFVKNSLRVDQTSEKIFAMLYNSVSKSERRI